MSEITSPQPAVPTPDPAEGASTPSGSVAPPADYTSTGAIPPLEHGTPPPAGEGKGWKAWVGAGAAAAVLAVGAGFVIGRSGSNDSPSAVNAGANAPMNQPANGGYGNQGNFQPGSFPGGGGAAGEITKIDGSTITVKAADGTTATVKTTDTTTVSEAVDGSVRDIAKGDNVIVIGTTSGAKVTASRIVDNGDQQLTFRGGPGGGPDGQLPDAQTGSQQLPSGEVPDGRPSTQQGGPQGQGPSSQMPGGQQGNQPGQGPNSQSGPGGPQGPGGQGMPGGRPTAGEVTKIDGSTITVKTFEGSTVTVTTTSDTTVTITKQLEVSDLKVGDTIRAMGQTTDGTTTAMVIRRGDLEDGPGFAPGDFGPGGQGPQGGRGPQDGSGATTQTTI